jgi:hypothetical protein
MADPAWHTSLPQSPLVDGFSTSKGKTVASWQPDTGPPLVRVRWSFGIRPMHMAFMMSIAQKDIFNTFYDVTLVRGSLPFRIKDPSLGVTVRALFHPEEAPSFVSPDGGRKWWRVECSLLVIGP